MRKLLRDEHEEEPLTVVRRFGLAQYQPEAPVYARGHRWKVIGLDPASPWNPRTEEPGWLYTLCGDCGLRFTMGPSFCPRCGTAAGLAKPLPGYEFGGFIAVRDDTPVLSRRIVSRRGTSCTRIHSGTATSSAAFRSPPSGAFSFDVAKRFAGSTRGRRRRLRSWRGTPILHGDGRGFLLCSACRRILKVVDNQDGKSKGQKKAKRATKIRTVTRRVARGAARLRSRSPSQPSRPR